MKCILCNQRKGKRYCPAKSAMICAQCCGEKRILEIDCPESCPYLQIGRGHEAAVENARHLRSADPIKQQKHARILNNFEGPVAYLEYVLAQERRASRNLTDKYVSEALDLLLATYRTEEKGVLYEQVSSNLSVDALRRRLRDVVESCRNPTEAHQERLRLSDAIECLELIRDLVGSHMASRESPTSYVDYLARVMPRSSEQGGRGSSLIVPG